MLKRFWLRRKLRSMGYCPDCGEPLKHGKGSNYCSACLKKRHAAREREAESIKAELGIGR